jgi:hypothetical protein
MGLIIPFAAFGVSVGVLLIWGFRAKKKSLRDREAASPRTAA